MKKFGFVSAKTVGVFSLMLLSCSLVNKFITPPRTQLPVGRALTAIPSEPAIADEPVPGDPSIITAANAAHVVELARVESGLEPWVSSVEFSPDSRLLVAAVADASVRVYDAATLHEKYFLLGHDARVGRVLFSPDGKFFVSGAEDGRILEWNPQTGEQTGEYFGASQQIMAMVFSPDGSRLIAGGKDLDLFVWDVPTRQLLHQMHGHEGVVHSLAYARAAGINEPLQLISVGYDEMMAWNTEAGELIGNVEQRGPTMTDFVVSIDGLSRATLFAGGGVELWHQGTSRQYYQVADAPSGSLAWSPDASLIAWGGTGDTTSFLVILDASNGAQLLKLHLHEASIEDVAWSPDGHFIATCGDDDRIILYGLQS